MRRREEEPKPQSKPKPQPNSARIQEFIDAQIWAEERITIDRRTRHLEPSRSIQLAVGADTSTINNSGIWSSERKLPSSMGTCRKKKEWVGLTGKGGEAR